MESVSDPVVRDRPQPTVRQPHSERTPASSVCGFPVAVNQYEALQSAEFQNSGQREEGLVDPRTTRSLRQAAKRVGNREKLDIGENSFAVHVENAAQGNFDSDICVEPVAVELSSQFIPYSFPASSSDILLQSGEPVHYMLGNGAMNVDGGKDALYISGEPVQDVACMDPNFKRISYAGPEWSAGRPGHTPIRRILACDKNIEDSCAGQDWSAGRPGNRPFGASSAACPSSQTACLGPYGAAYRQLHHTGSNPREETLQAPSSTRDLLPSTSQQTTASPARRNAAEDRASPAKVALQPRRPPYFSGGLDEDVHTWTSIVTRWLDAIQGEPIAQLTFIVSLLRGVAYDWYQHFETRTGCPGDWTMLRLALLQRFGTSIHAEKARADLYQLKQDKMTVLQYADAFELRLAQIENYDESYYLIHFIFGLHPEIMRGVYLQQPASILAAKEMAEKLELTHQCTAQPQKHTKTKKTNKAARQRGTQERRSGRWRKSDAVQLKACQSQNQRQKRRPKVHSTEGCTAHSRAF